MITEKEEKLRAILKSCTRAAIAFSGGVDSSFLAAVAKNTLGASRVELFTASLHMSPSWELRDAVSTASFLGLSHHVIEMNELSEQKVAQNPTDRCYYCKKFIFNRIADEAKKLSCDVIFDGSNIDDNEDYRPGMKAARELGIISPLALAGLNKNEIRGLSKRSNLPFAQKPSGACLGSRIPYGQMITDRLLRKIERAEEGIHQLGFEELRVRVHGDCARLEVSVDRMDFAWKMRKKLTAVCKQAGFCHVALDMSGYFSGSMNACLNRDD